MVPVVYLFAVHMDRLQNHNVSCSKLTSFCKLQPNISDYSFVDGILQTLFASAVAPVQSISNLLHGLAWIWIHLLLCNVSNQAQSGHEDSINHPWRPIPSGRLTEHQATRFRWALVLFCTLYSTFYGKQNVLATTALITATIFHDDLGMSGNPLGKNLCNVGGYTSFEFGAINIIGKLFFFTCSSRKSYFSLIQAPLTLLMHCHLLPLLSVAPLFLLQFMLRILQMLREILRWAEQHFLYVHQNCPDS